MENKISKLEQEIIKILINCSSELGKVKKFSQRSEIINYYKNEMIKILQVERKTVSANKDVREVCNCTCTQACKICAASKDIDWSIIENRQTGHT